MTWGLTRKLWDEKTALYALILLGATAQFMLLAKSGQLDAMVSMWVMLGCYGLVKAHPKRTTLEVVFCWLVCNGPWYHHQRGWFFTCFFVDPIILDWHQLAAHKPMGLCQMAGRPDIYAGSGVCLAGTYVVAG